MITGVQIRCARGALSWSADLLAEKAGIAAKTVRRLEAIDGVPTTKTSTLSSIQSALEAAGIEFIGSPDNAPGIRIHTRASERG